MNKVIIKADRRRIIFELKAPVVCSSTIPESAQAFFFTIKTDANKIQLI